MGGRKSVPRRGNDPRSPSREERRLMRGRPALRLDRLLVAGTFRADLRAHRRVLLEDDGPLLPADDPRAEAVERIVVRYRQVDGRRPDGIDLARRLEALVSPQPKEQP